MTLHTTFGTYLSEADYTCIQYAANRPLLLLPAPQRLIAKAKALGITINRRIALSAPPGGKRDIEAIARLLRAYCERIREAQRDCPTDDEYQTALRLETDSRLVMHGYRTKESKQAYEDAKAHRVQIGGAIIGARSVQQRMTALICGELAALGLLKAEVA